MKQLLLVYQNASENHIFVDGEAATTAYNAVRDAVREYKEYGNDKEKTITIKTAHGETTIRLAALVSVGITDRTASHDDEFEVARVAFWREAEFCKLKDSIFKATKKKKK